MFVPPTPDDRSTINCNSVNDNDCRFAVYVLSGGTPLVSQLFSSEHLHLNIEMPTKTTISSSGQVFIVPVTIQRQSSGTEIPTLYDICLKVSELTSLAIRRDAKCFHVEFTNKEIAVMHPRETDNDFIKPTPASESTITCELQGLCHFLVYTEAKGTTFNCEQVVSSPEFPVGVSKPVVLKLSPVSAICETNIVVKVTSSNTKRICLKSWEQGDSRCYRIMTLNNITSPCLSNTCKNEGVCQVMKDGSIKCHCTGTFKGDFCEEGPCPTSSTTCKNSAHCHMDGNLEKCICPYGFWGTTCNHRSAENATNTATDGGKFISTALPDTVQCYQDKVCRIPLSVTGDRQSTELSTSYVDTHVTVQSISRQQQNPPASSSTYTSVMEVVGKIQGMHKVCVQTNGKNGRSGDEVCVNINVNSGHADPVSKTQPYYLEPTLPHKTTVECIVNTQCHLKLWASDRDGCTDCPVVIPSEKSTKAVYIFQPIGKPLKCPTDVVLQDNTVHEKQICFTVTSTTAFLGTKNGETRCYDIQFRSTSAAKSPCGETVCENGGRCDGHSGVAVCTCLSGYSGTHCHDKNSISQTVPSSSQGNRNSSIFGDAAIPDEIHCQLKQPCSVPLSVLSNISPVLGIGSRDNSLNFSSPQLHVDALTGAYHGKIDVVPGAIGTYHACVHTLDSSRKINDEICFKVAVSNSSNYAQQHQNQPHFQSPTIASNSTVNCRPGQTCHMKMSLSPGMYGKCPNVQSTNTPPPYLHVTHSSDNKFVRGNCTADVAIHPQITKTGMETFCFQTYLPSVPGETRCITVNYAAKTPTQCIGKICLNGGYCDSLQAHGNCICPSSTSGNMCETVIFQSTESTISSEFTDGNLYVGNNVCSSLAPAMAKDHAAGGRIECECRDSITSKTTLVVKRNMKASIQQIVRASAIGAAGCVAAITIATVIYVLVGKLKMKLDTKSKPGKVNPKPKTSKD